MDDAIRKLRVYLEELHAIHQEIITKAFNSSSSSSSSSTSSTSNISDQIVHTNDEMMLSNPMPVQRMSINQIRHSLGGDISCSSGCFLPKWFAETMAATNVFGTTYTWKQVRVVLGKGMLILKSILSQMESGTSSSGSYFADIKGLYDTNPERFGDALFSLYLYSSNYSNCTCANLNECDQVIQLERTGLVNGRYDPSSRYGQVHPVCRVQPTNQPAHGYNSAIWALANWSLRIAQDGQRTGESPEVIAAAKTGVETLSPFIKILSHALNHLGSVRNILFRGIRGKVKYPYARGDVITWPSFSSTSLDEEVAKSFMNDEGTFFIITAHSPHMINWISWFPLEAEALLNLGACFEVKGRMSNTLLSMLGSNSEIITLAETGSDGNLSPAEEAEVALLSLKKSLFVYETYMKTYVLGYLSASATSRIGGMDLDALLELFKGKIQGAHDGAIPKMAIIGAGGTGKTSCMLYILSKFMSSLSLGLNGTRSVQSEQWIPLFVPLPMASFTEEGGIDRYVLRDLRLREESFETFCSGSRKVILLMDSLDEVDFQNVENTTEIIQSVLDRNPLVKRLCKGVILSSRPEIFGNKNTLRADAVFAGGNMVYHVHPFVDQDMETYILKAVVNAGRPANDSTRVVGVIKADQMWNLVRNPYMLHMLVTTLLDDESLVKACRGGLEESGLFELYESYFYHLAKQKRLAKAVLLKDAETLAMGLHFDGTSQGQVSKYANGVFSFLQLPLRVENAYASVGDDADANDSTFCFRHKSLQEFLVSRFLYNYLAEHWDGKAFDNSDPWVKSGYLGNHPNVIKLFVDRLNRDPSGKVKEALGRWAARSSTSKVGASSALTVLAQGRVVMSTLLPDLKGAEVENAYLDGGIFSGLDLTGASFIRCSMRGVDLSYTQLKNVGFTDSKVYLSPSLDFAYHISSMDCNDASKYIVVCGEKFVTLLRSDNLKEAATVQIITEHTCSISSCKLSFNGERVAVQSHDYVSKKTKVSIYSVKSLVQQKPNKPLELKGGNPTFSPCSKYICTLGNELCLFDAKTGKEIYQEKSGVKYMNVSCVAFSPDSTKMVAFLPSFTFMMYDIRNGKVMQLWKADPGFTRIENSFDFRDLQSMQITPDGKFLVASGNLLAAISFDRFRSMDPEKEHHKSVDKDFDGVTIKPSAFHFMHGGKQLVHYHNESLCVFDFESSSKIASWSLKKCGPLCANSERNEVLVVEADSTRIRVFNSSSGADELNFRAGHMNDLSEVEFIPGTTKFLSSGLDNRTFIHSFQSNALRSAQLGYDATYAYKFSPCGHLLCILNKGTGTPSAYVYVYRVSDGDKFDEIFHQRTSDRSCGAFAHNGSHLAFSYTSYDWNYGPKTHEGDTVINGLHIVPVKELLEVSQKDLHMNLNTGWKPKWRNAIRYESFQPKEHVIALAWSPDDSKVAVATLGDKVNIYLLTASSVEEMQKLGTFPIDEVVMQFSSDGDKLFVLLVGHQKFHTISIHEKATASPKTGISGILFSSSKRICAVRLNNCLQLFQLPEMSQLSVSEQIQVFSSLRRGGEKDYPVWKWAPDDHTLAVGCDGGYRVAIVSVSSENDQVFVWGYLQGFLAPVSCVAFSSDSTKCIVGSMDAIVRVFSIENGNLKFLLEHPAATPALSALGSVGLEDAEDDLVKRVLQEHSQRRAGHQSESKVILGKISKT